MSTLRITDGPARGTEFALERHRLIMIGRDPSCSFQVVDELISRRHLQIKFEETEQRHYALDAGSANGVLVNGDRISAPVPLSHGDVIKIGASTITYSTTDPSQVDGAASVRRAYDTTKLAD